MSEPENPVTDYFLRYGLEQDPFSEQVDQDFYFETPPLSQRLDLVLHLVEFSHETVMILGETGMGKTAMLNHVRARAPANWRTCRISADPMRDAISLLTEIASGFQLPLASGAGVEAATEALQVHLRASEQSMLVPVVLVDDAHELPVDALALLLQLAQPAEQRVRLRLILFCEPQVTGMLVHPKLRKFKQGIMHTLDIPALTNEQALEYLQARLEYAGLEGGGPFDANLAERLNRTAEGRPGRLNALARQALIGGELGTQKAAPRPAPVRTGRLQRRHVVVAAVLLAASVLLAVLMQGPEHPARQAQQPETVPLQLPTEQAPEVSTVASPPPQPAASAAPAQEPVQTAGAQAPGASPPAATAVQPPQEAMASSTAEAAAQHTPAETAPTPTENEPQPAEKPAPQQPPAPEKPSEEKHAPPASEAKASTETPKATAESAPKVTKKTVASKPEPKAAPAKPETAAAKPKAKAVPAKPQPKAAPAPTAEAAGAAWVRAQPPEHYVLQLYASHDMDSVRKFLRDYHLERKAHTVATRHGRKLWYVVLYGSYRDRTAAGKARATLPPRIQQLKPWPRTFAAVSKVLEKKP